LLPSCNGEQKSQPQSPGNKDKKREASKPKVRTFMDWGKKATMETVDEALHSFTKRSRLHKHALIALGKIDPMGIYVEGDAELARLASCVNSLCDIDHAALGGLTGAHEQRLQIMAKSKALCLKQNATPYCQTVVEAVRKSIAVVEGLEGKKA
jgi:hypothetical protein